MPDDNSEIDEMFERMTEDLDIPAPQVAMVTVSTLSDYRLSKEYNRVRRELHERGEMLNPTTETGKDLQTEFQAYVIEMRKRGLL